METKTRTVIHDPAQEEAARGGWYLRARDHFVAALAQTLARPTAGGTPSILDAGCGTGGLVQILEQRQYRVMGVDADEESLLWGRKMGRLRTFDRQSVTNLAFPDDSFDLAVASEVLEHVPDDVQGLRELLRVSRGPVLLTVPAHPYLWTDSDDLLLHQRRYTRDGVRKLAADAGANLVALHAYAVVPGLGVLLYRMFRRGKKNDLPLTARLRMGPTAERIVGALFRAELWMSRRGLIPWGHGWWAVVRKR